MPHPRFPDRPIRLWKAFGARPKSLTYPFYLPSGLTDIETSFRRGLTREAISELERKAALGSVPAKAALGFLYFHGALPDGVNLDRAIELLAEPVAHGDAYAMYVRGFVYLYREQDAVPAVRLWVASANLGFSPSQLALADFLAQDWLGKPGDPDKALRSYIQAARMGHRAAPAKAAWNCRYHRNWLKRVLAWAALPFCMLWLYSSMRADMFSDCVFGRICNQRLPFFSDKAWDA